MNLNDKKFITIENRSGLSTFETVFHYFQDGTTITGTYKGGAIQEGFIVGKQTEPSKIELLFQCLTTENELKVGQSIGVISTTKNGKLKLTFDWSWLNGDLSQGTSQYVEVD